MNLQRRQPGVAFLVLALLLTPTVSQSQQLMNFITRTTIPIVIQCPGCNKARANADKQEDIPAVRPPPVAAGDPANLSFIPSLALRQKMEADLAAIGRRADPSGTFTQLLTRTPPIATMHRRMAAAGLDPNDFGSALAVFLATQWALANGAANFPTRAHMEGIRAQFAPTLSAERGLRSASNAVKQEGAEGLLLEAHYFRVLMEASAGKPSSVAQLSAGATQKLQSYGIDPALMTLTAQGFERAQ